METDAKDIKPKGARRDAKGGPRVTYASRPDATPEGELTALAAVYAFVIQAHERKAAASYDEDVEGR
jgi:hypothetical protein